MNPIGADSKVHVRKGNWCQKRLRKHFHHVGNRVLIKRDVEMLQ